MVFLDGAHHLGCKSVYDHFWQQYGGVTSELRANQHASGENKNGGGVVYYERRSFCRTPSF